MSGIYRRLELAQQMAQQLLRPSVLDEGLRSGLFLSGLRRTGKTTFLVNDLIPALEEAGAIVIYVDLWSDTQTAPAALLRAAVRQTLAELQTPASAVLQKLKRLAGVDVEAFGFKFGFALEHIGRDDGVTLAQALMAVVDQAQTSLVLVVDEVQQAITSDDGHQMLLALKAARDAINPRPNTPGHFIFIGTGSHRALVSELTARRNQAFVGATSLEYPVLKGDYIRHLLARLGQEDGAVLPSYEVCDRAFVQLGHRPEEMLKALRQLRLHLPPGGNPDEHLPVIAAMQRTATADVELMKVEQLGGLATAVFERMAATVGDARKVFSAEAAAQYAQVLGRDVRVDEIQPAVNDLLAANLILRKGHGSYAITDPFVQEVWREKKAMAAWG